MRNEDFVSDFNIEWVQDNALGNAKSVDVNEAIRSLFEQCAATIRETFDDEYSRSFVIEQLLLSVSKKAVESQPSLGMGLIYSDKFINFFMEKFVEAFDFSAFVQSLMENEHIVNYIKQVEAFDTEAEEIEHIDYATISVQLVKIDRALRLMEELNLSTDALVCKQKELIDKFNRYEEGNTSLEALFAEWKQREI